MAFQHQHYKNDGTFVYTCILNNTVFTVLLYNDIVLNGHAIDICDCNMLDNHFV